MSNFQMFVNESRAAQHQQDMMHQAAAERSLRAMRLERRQQQQDARQGVAQPKLAPSAGSSRLRQAWGAFAGLMASFF